MSPVSQVEKLIAQVRESLTQSAANLTEACASLVQAYDLDPIRSSELLADISPDTIRRMLSVGRGQRLASLLLAARPGEIALARCDIAVQRRFLEEPVPVVEPSKPDEHRLIPVAELSAAQASQVFHRGRMYSVSEQRTWIAEHARPQLASRTEPTFRVARDKLTVIKPCVLTRSQLFGILQEMR